MRISTIGDTPLKVAQGRRRQPRSSLSRFNYINQSDGYRSSDTSELFKPKTSRASLTNLIREVEEEERYLNQFDFSSPALGKGRPGRDLGMVSEDTTIDISFMSDQGFSEVEVGNSSASDLEDKTRAITIKALEERVQAMEHFLRRLFSSKVMEVKMSIIEENPNAIITKTWLELFEEVEDQNIDYSDWETFIRYALTAART